MISTNKAIPAASIIKQGLKGKTDYEDSFSVILEGCDRLSIDDLTAVLFTSTPSYINFLLKLRDLLVKPFGLETGDLSMPDPLDGSLAFSKGERAVFFTVLEKSDHEIVMGEDDKHLYFRTSVLKQNHGNRSEIFLNTVVQFHNAFGKIYFIPVKPFHRMIVKSMLSGFRKNCEKL